MTLLELLQLMRKNSKLVIALPVACALVVAIYAYGIMPNEYTASGSMNATKNAATLVTLLKSDDIVSAAYEAAGVSASDGYSIAASVANSSTIVTVTGKGHNADATAQVVNEVMRLGAKQAETTIGAGTTTIVTRAQAPGSSSGPKRVQYVLVAFIMGLLIALCVVVAGNSIRSRRQSVESIENLLHIPVIASFPDGTQDLLKSIHYASADAPLKSIVFVSATEGEGVSEVALALARANAADGKRSLLVRTEATDCGLCAVVTGENGLQQAVQPLCEAGGDVLPVEADIPNIGSVYSSQSFAQVLSNQLHVAYDCVVFDAPAFAPVPSALPLAKACDATIFVVQRKENDENLLKQASDALLNYNANVLGAVLMG